ncbi:lipoate-protein ligase A [Candidatus Mancarchaeum acidiphilum]|uniref:Lipoate-protein ligase A n=2 Tax=Candidatus Mancarchaeum acidiphilum TaxID=1920749 RepID=A0A218NM53_9ARCH|nr:lipoate-protein ligase A [Candidatus Mancarchaeum acidiphilum]
MTSRLSAKPKIKSDIYYLGYQKNSIFDNMAIDEVLMELADKENKFFFRLYDFNKDSIILAFSDSMENVKAVDGNVELTRRLSAGKPIYIDDNVLSYSFIGPMKDNGTLKNGESIHDFFGTIIMDSIKSISNDPERPNIKLGKAYSIKVGEKPIVGNGQHISLSHSFMYHGIIAVGKWNAEKVNAYLNLVRKDYEALKDLPSIESINRVKGQSIEYYKSELIKQIIKNINNRFNSVKEISKEESNEINKMKLEKVPKYKDIGWIDRKDILLKKDSRFCLLWPD